MRRSEEGSVVFGGGESNGSEDSWNFVRDVCFSLNEGRQSRMVPSVRRGCSCFLVKCVAWGLRAFISKVGPTPSVLGLHA